jgi:hypothetical protein
VKHASQVRTIGAAAVISRFLIYHPPFHHLTVLQGAGSCEPPLKDFVHSHLALAGRDASRVFADAVFRF